MNRIYIKPVIRVIEENEPLLTTPIVGSNGRSIDTGDNDNSLNGGGLTTGDRPHYTSDTDNPELSKDNALGWDDISGW